MKDQVSTVITLKNVTKRFRKFAAVADVSLEVSEGETVGFVGENGAGKTTTISMLLGFTSPSQGIVEVFGRQITPASAHTSHGEIGYAAGDMELPMHMTGEQYIRFVMAQSSATHTARYKELVDIFHPQLEKRIGTLSRGNKQKIALVAAFLTEPKLIVLDEPTSGLDPVMQEAFLDMVRRETARGATVFMSSHYLQEVAEVCSRVLLMKDGRIVEDLTAEQLAEKGGKVVTIETAEKVELPEFATALEHTKQDDTYIVSFAYTGKIGTLLEWLSLAKVSDVSIAERTLEDEFKHIYNQEAEEGDEDDE